MVSFTEIRVLTNASVYPTIVLTSRYLWSFYTQKDQEANPQIPRIFEKSLPVSERLANDSHYYKTLLFVLKYPENLQILYHPLLLLVL